jgi:hypothetical protein
MKSKYLTIRRNTPPRNERDDDQIILLTANSGKTMFDKTIIVRLSTKSTTSIRAIAF